MDDAEKLWDEGKQIGARMREDMKRYGVTPDQLEGWLRDKHSDENGILPDEHRMFLAMVKGEDVY